MATVLVVSTLLSPFSAVSTASAEDAGHLTPGIYKPTPIGIGTNIDVSTPDPGVATYVGRDMYIGGKPSNTKTLDASNAPAGSYAAEAEGLTVVRGKLAMNPLKESWPYERIGAGFRFGTVGFGSQFRPVDGSTVLAVAGIDSAITNMSVGYSGDLPGKTTVGAWNKGAWVGKARTADSAGYDYTAKIAGPITYWNTNNRRQSVVKTQGYWYAGENAQDSTLFNQVNFLKDINGKDYSNYSGETGYLNTLSNQLNSFAKTGKVSYGVAPALLRRAIRTAATSSTSTTRRIVAMAWCLMGRIRPSMRTAPIRRSMVSNSRIASVLSRLRATTPLCSRCSPSMLLS